MQSKGQPLRFAENACSDAKTPVRHSAFRPATVIFACYPAAFTGGCRDCTSVKRE